jgi:hypothetical protein
VPLSQLKNLKLRSTSIGDLGLGRLLSLTPRLERLDISYTQARKLDFVRLALVKSTSDFRLTKLVLSGLNLARGSLESFTSTLSQLPDEQRSRLKTLKLGTMGGEILNDTTVYKMLPDLCKLQLESLSFHNDRQLGSQSRLWVTFMASVARRCKVRSSAFTLLSGTELVPVQHLDLTGLSNLRDDVFEGLLGFEEDQYADAPEPDGPPALETLILDGVKVGDSAAPFISSCVNLRELHLDSATVTRLFPFLFRHVCAEASMTDSWP